MWGRIPSCGRLATALAPGGKVFAVFYLDPGNEGGPPICPVGLTVFWLLTAAITSLAVMFSLAN